MDFTPKVFAWPTLIPESMLTPNMEERASPLRARPILSLRPIVLSLTSLLGGACCCWRIGTERWPAADAHTTGGWGKPGGDTGSIRGRAWEVHNMICPRYTWQCLHTDSWILRESLNQNIHTAGPSEIPLVTQARYIREDHWRWRYHHRLSEYQSPYFHLKLPLDLRTMGNHQILLEDWIIKLHTVIWNNFGTIIYLDHRRPHLHLKILLDHKKRLGDHQGSCTDLYFHLKPPSSDNSNEY